MSVRDECPNGPDTAGDEGNEGDEGEEGGVVFMVSACFGCGRPFTYNPLKVPSIPAALSPTSHREPLCRRCWTRRQEYRQRHNLPREALAADAYEPLPVDEFPIDALGK